MENVHGQITPQLSNIDPDLIMDAPATMSAHMHGPVATQSSVEDRD
jgi:hypothetical protein